MSDIVSSSFNEESINVVLNYQPPNLVNVEDDINQTRVILRQPATVVNVGERPLLEYAEVALSASYAKSASFIADDSDIYDWVRTTFYVSATDGNDDNDGKTPIYPFRTIKRAARAAKEFITGSRLIDPTIPEEAPRVTIRLSTGFYEEEAPIQIPEWTSVCGNDLRTCVVRPTPETKGENLFQVNRGFYADGLRLEGCEIDDLTNPRKGFFFAFQEGAYITTSPYIQNCTAAYVPFDKFYAPLDPFATPQPNPEIGNGPGGMIVDDSVLDPYSPLKSMIVDAYTQVAFNGIGLVTRGAGYAQMVSFFTNFSHVGTWAIDGGHASLLNSNTTFGDYGLRAEGYRVIVVPDYDGVNSYQSEADSLLVSQSINDVRNYMMTQLQLSGSYRTDYLDTSSRIHQLTLKDSGLLIDAIATDLLALTPGKTVNWIQSQFKGQDVSADKRYTIPTSSATSASGFVRGPYAAFRINDNTYTASVPFTQPSASRDSGYLINAVATDILYGGNERSVEAARWFWVRPSVANTSQLQPTLDGIQIVKELAQNALEAVSQSAFVSKSSAGIQLSYDVLEQGGTASLSAPVPNTFDPIKVTNLSSVTSATTISQSLVNQATASFEIVYSIITDGTGSMPPLVTNAENLIRVTTASAQFTTASSAVSRAASVVSGFNIVLNIIENGTGSLPTTVLNTANNIKVTAFAPTTSSASATLTEVSSSETLFNVITSIITNGTGSLPAVISNDTGSIRFTDVAQITSASAASGSEVTTISSSFAIVNYIIINGTGSMPALVENTSGSIKFNNTAQITSASGAGNDEVAKISSSAAIVTNIITNGTGSAPALVLNTSESIKFTDTAQITSASSATTTESDIISSSFAIVTKIITEGTGSIPTLVENTSGSIKFTNLTTTTSASSAGNAEVTKISSSMALIMDIISSGTGSLPTVISNTTESIKFTNTAQITSASSATSTEVTKVSSSMAIVTNIIINGTGSLPTLIENTSESIKFTNTAQVTSASAAGNTEVAKISSSFATVYEIVQDGTGSLPIIVYNTEENIKFTNEPQVVSGSISASAADITAISSSIAIVKNILLNGTGSLPGVIPYTTQSSDPNTIAAYYLLKDNIEFIKKEVVAFISSSWSTASYNEASCSRDIGYIVSGAAEDLLYGSNSSSIYNGIYYFLFPSQATGSQLSFTVDGVDHANQLAQKVIQNIPFNTGSIERRAGWDLLTTNLQLIQEETIAYISSSWSTASYDQDKCKRDVNYIIDAVKTDLYYGGNARSVNAGVYYYLYPSQAETTQINQTLDGIKYASRLAQKIVQNVTLVTGSAERRATWDLLRANRTLLQNEVIAYISSSWSTASYNEDTCKRDVGYIIDAVSTDVYYGGNERSIEAGRYYYLYPSQATGSQLNFTIDGINHASGLAQQLIQNITLVTGSVERRATWDLLRSNIQFIQDETIAYISSSWSTASYNEDTCKRDVNYILDAVMTDVYYGGNQRSIEAGRYYYLYPSQATGAQLNFTIDGIKYASRLAQKVAQNVTFTTASVERRIAWELLRANSPFIQEEVIAYISSSWSTASYDSVKCRRDVNYILDSVSTDIYYGGNERSIEAGRYYYLYPSQATGNQVNFTVDGINHASWLGQKVVRNVTFTTASVERRATWDLLQTNKAFIQSEVISYISSSWSTASYDQDKCYRDVGYIIDGIATDIYYGGNQRSIESGRYYYLYPSQATNTQLDFTIDGVNYASRIAQKIAQNVTFTTASLSRQIAWQLLRANSPFIQAEVIAYISSSWSTASYDETKCKRDVNYILDSVSTDVLYGGNERSRQAGFYYYKYPSQATGAQVNFTVDGIEYASKLGQKVVQNVSFVTASVGRRAAWQLMRQNIPFIREEVIAYVSSSWPTASYDQDKCKRDVGYIVDSVSTDILYGGNERSIEAGRYYYLYPNQATTSQLNFTIDAINYAKGLAKKLILNTPYAAPDSSSWAAKELLIRNKPLIQAEVIQYISSSWVTSSRSMVGFVYDQDKCFRDVGYILDGVATDILYGGNERSIESGRYYYLYPNEATNNRTQLDPTLDGIEYARNIAVKIVSGSTLVTASANSLAARELLNNNRAFIQAETIAFLSSSWRDFNYSSVTCSRDIGYIIDAVKTDLVYGGNQRSRDAGFYYYKYPNQATSAQDAATVAGVRYAKNLAQRILQNATFVTASADRIAAANALFANKAYIQEQVVTRLLTNKTFDEADTLRDSGYIIQAAATDILYGGNERSTEAGRYFYKFPSGVLNAVKSETLEGIALVKEYAQNYLESTIAKSEIPSLRDKVDIVYDILENGTGSIANVLIPNASGATRFTDEPQFTSSATISSSLIESASNVLQVVLDIIEYGTGSIPTLVKNTSGRIKRTTSSSVQYTGSISQSLINLVTASADVTIQVLEDGTGSLPTLIPNTINNIKVTNTTQYTGSVTASSAEITKVSSSFALVTNILINGTGSLPSLVLNTSESIKYTGTAQVTSSATASSAEVTKVSSSVASVVNVIINGTGSLPALVLNTAENIKFTTASQVTSASAASAPEITKISSSMALITNIIASGTGSLPSAVLNTSENIKFTNTAQVTSASSAGNGEVTKISSSAAIVTDIIASGTGSLPTIVLNTSESIKFTDTVQIISASSAGNAEVTKISSSIFTISDIIGNGTGSLPTITTNVSESIKFTTASQAITSSYTANGADIVALSSSIALVADIVRNGTGSLPALIPYTTPSTDPATITAYNLIKSNIPFIQAEVIAYISSSWSTASYNEASCSRDIGYIVSGAAEDLLYGSNSASLANGIYYYLFPSQATGNQVNFTVDGIQFANEMTQQVAQNITFVTASTERLVAWQLLRANKTFLQNETIAYISSSWSTASYDENTCKRDVGYIVDALATDIYYGGNQRTVEAGRYYYLYPSQATGAQANFTIDGIKFAGEMAQKLIQNTVFNTGSAERRVAWNLLRANRTFLQNEVIAYISSSWSTASYNEDTCKRDVGYIVDAISTDVYYGGNQRSVEAGRYYYLYPSQATGNQANFTIDGIKFASNVAQKLVQNVTFTTGSASRRVVWNLLNANKTFIQEEVIAYISSSWSTASYDQDKCKRDVGYIIDAVVTDIYYGGNERSIEAGRYYYLYPSQATSTQENFTIDGINHASWLAQKVVQNISFSTASQARRNAWNLLRQNKQFVQDETIAWLSASWYGFDYDSAKCHRDIGYIIDGVATDIYYGGNERSRESGRYYYLYPSQATGSQLDPTVDGIEHAGILAQKVIQSISFVTASESRLAVRDILYRNIPLLQNETVAYISSSWSTASYDETKCKRDVGYIVGGIIADVLYGGNQRTRESGIYYYTYPSQATGNQLDFTVDGVNYASRIAQKLLVNTELSLPSDDVFSAYKVARANKEFIAAEVIPYISSSWSTLDYNSDKCRRDVTYIVDGITTDFLYGGNERSIQSGYYYYYIPSEVTGEQVEETSTGIRYIANLVEAIMQGATFSLPTQNQLDAAELLFNNKQFIAEEIIPYVSASWSGSTYNGDKCKRDVGYILDGVITDIVYGGNERSIQSGLFYYLYPSVAVTSELDFTYAGTRYLKGMAIEVLKNTVFQEVDPVRQFVFDTLVANKAAIAQAVLNKLLDGQEKCMVCDYILAHNKIREYLIDDPEGRLTDLTPAAKVKIGQLMAMVTGTLESVVLDLQPTYLQEFGSLITSTSHVFEFGGSGANYLALPSNQYGIGQSNFDLRVFQADGGRIYTSFGDETGDFFIGLDFTIRQATGTIEGRTFNKATAARFTPLILALT